MRRRPLIVIGVACSCIAVSLAIAAQDKARQEEKRAAKEDLYQQVELFSDALAIIEEEYVTPTFAKELIYGALKGMLMSLDAHSQFLDPDSYRELKSDTEGTFAGLGVEITIKDGLLTVITPIEDTPAWNAGLKAGDRIVKINDEITRDMTLNDAVKRLRGKVGEKVTLTVLREAEKRLIEIGIIRDIIKVKAIKDARILEDGIAYLRLVEFRERTPEDMDATLAQLQSQGMNALIIDLRNNPGGLLDTASAVSERFIEPDKLIVSTKGKKKSQTLEFRSHHEKPLLDMPIAVLINEGSASGSEIVAGCLQDYKRAIIVGVKSFGKGSVQSVIPLRDGSALRLTTSTYYTPLGREIHGKGVIPDIVVENARIEPAELSDTEPPSERAKEVFEELDPATKEEPLPAERNYKQDNQLVCALDILKALLLFKGTPRGTTP